MVGRYRKLEGVGRYRKLEGYKICSFAFDRQTIKQNHQMVLNAQSNQFPNIIGESNFPPEGSIFSLI